MGPDVHFFLSVLGSHLVSICTGLVPDATVSVSSYVISHVGSERQFPWSHLSTLALTVSPTTVLHNP